MGKLKGIYIIKNIINDKCYIGQSVNLKDRMYSYKNIKCKNQSKLYNALNKYGYDNFKIDFLFTTEKDYNHIHILLDLLEIYFIKKYDSVNNGYNIKFGGANGKCSDEFRKKMIDILTGRKCSDETKEKLRLSNIGKNNPMYNKKGILSKSSKPIIQYDLNDNFIKEWTNAKEACDVLNLNPCLISMCCTNQRKTTGKFKWKFK